MLSSLVYSSLNEFIHYTRIYTGFCGWKFKYYKYVSYIKFIVNDVTQYHKYIVSYVTKK